MFRYFVGYEARLRQAEVGMCSRIYLHRGRVSALCSFILITEYYIKREKQMDWTGLEMTLRLRLPAFLLILIDLLVEHKYKLASV